VVVKKRKNGMKAWKKVKGRLFANLASKIGRKKVVLPALCLPFALSSLLFALYFGACALPMGLEHLTGTGTPSGPGTYGIAGEDLLSYFREPVAGEMPLTAFEAPGYTGTVVWTAGEAPLNGAFQDDTGYAAAVTLSARPGYSFKGLPAAPGEGSFFHSRSVEADHPAGIGSALEIIVRFGVIGPGLAGSFAVTDYNLQQYVPVPVAGEAPVTKLDLPNLSLVVQWKDMGGNPINPAAFVEGAQYQAIIMLEAQGAWRFVKGHPFAYYPAESVAYQRDDFAYLLEDKRVVSVTYQTTAKVKAVTDLDLALHIPAPVTGETATWFILGNGDEYMGSVQWREVENLAAMRSRVFQFGKVYQAVVVLYAGPGYTLRDAVFTYKGKDGGELIAGQGTGGADSREGLVITFPPTEPRSVTDRDLTSLVPAPVPEAEPALSFTSPNAQYTGEVTWVNGQDEPLVGAFGAFTVYKAVVKLTVLGDYALGDGGFEHHDGEALPGSHAAEVIIVFPQTGGVLAAVTDLDLAAYLPGPAQNQTPQTSFSGSQYTGTAAWVTGGKPYETVFQPAIDYTVTAVLTAEPGYTFAVTAFTYNGELLVQKYNSVGSITVTINFSGGSAPGLPYPW
jgi:hypothetical protein